MTTNEALPEDPELVAKRAVWDYLNLEPDACFGELPPDVFDDWIAACEASSYLEGRERLALGWMYAERACGQFAVQTYSGGVSRPEAAVAVQDDLRRADNCFGRAIESADAGTTLALYAKVAKAGLPLFRLWFDCPPDKTDEVKIRFLEDICAISQEALQAYKARRSIGAVPHLNMLAMLYLTAQSTLGYPSQIILPGAYRNVAGRDNGYGQWQLALASHDMRGALPVRIAPTGPSHFMLLPASLLKNREYASHAAGTLEAVIQLQVSIREAKAVKAGTHQGPFAYGMAVARKANSHIDTVETGIMESMRRQFGLVDDGPAEQPNDPVAWYAGLSPFSDPTHRSHGDLFNGAMSELEIAVAEGRATTQQRHALAQMHLEAAMSATACTEGVAAQAGAFDRVMDLLESVLLEVAEQGASSEYFEACISAIAAGVCKSLVINDVSEEAMTPGDVISDYILQLATTAHVMLKAYPHLRETDEREAAAVAEQFQRVTALLLATKDGYVALPSSPRQRGNSPMRGWDFVVWSEATDGSYRPGLFVGRLSTKDDPASVDENVVTIPSKVLGQWQQTHDFRTLRDLISLALPDMPRRNVDHGRINKAMRALRKIPDASDDAVNI